MFGLGKTHKKNTDMMSTTMDKVRVLTIPAIFYGGNDPQIYHHQHEDVVDKTVLGKQKKSSKKQQTKVQKKQIPGVSRSNKRIWIGGSIVFVIVACAVSWYYLRPYFASRNNNTDTQLPAITVKQNDTTQNTNTNTNENENPVIKNNESTSTIDVVTSTEEVIFDPASLSQEFINFPLLLTLDTADTDGDDLTDIEEELFNTDSGAWDSDEDGYYDGQELTNLYNPRGFAPVRLIDSGLVDEYVHPRFAYRVYYPRTWQRGDVDSEARQVLFSSIDGSYVEIRVSQKTTNVEDFSTWFGRHAQGQRFSDIRQLKNRFSVEAWVRRDSLVAYFDDSQYMYVMIYHPRDNGPVVYRQVMQMMYQSFRLRNNSEELPDQQAVVGIENPTATTTSVDNTTSTSNIL